jgi:hypothetical protein
VGGDIAQQVTVFTGNINKREQPVGAVFIEEIIIVAQNQLGGVIVQIFFRGKWRGSN